MLRKELISNSKGFIIFTSIMLLMLLGVALIYPTITDSFTEIDEMLKAFPKELLEAFNMNVASLSTITGWLLTEGYILIQLASACYFAVLGSTILLKETSDKTIEFLYSKPVSKKQIIEEKMKCGIIYVLIYTAVIALTIYASLLINKEFDMKMWLLISSLHLFTTMFFFTISMFVSLFVKKTNACISINMGLLFVLYLLNTLSLLSDKISFIKYFSIFYYIDSKDIAINNALDASKIAPVCIVIFLIKLISVKFYEKKELGL